MTATLSMEQFVELMRSSADDDFDIDLARPDLMDAEFDELGFDSLSQVELIEQLRDRLGLPMPSEIVDELTTPNALFGYVVTELGKP
jgi:acyl carrier protein